MDYPQALACLDALASHGIRPGLERVRKLLTRLGNPQRDFRSVLIAGTNGKGSVAAMLASIAGEAGTPAGLFTSPHLIRFEERIAIGGDPIAPDDLAALTGEMAAAVDAQRHDGDDPPTYFEASTAIAFLYFSRRRLPLAVLEVGMGGRFDATNIVAPVACGITRIAMDHTEWLGETLAAIAYQKAGILRREVPAVIARQVAVVRGVIREEADRVGAPLVETSDSLITAAGAEKGFPDPPVFDLQTPSGERYERLQVALRGDHQVDNATLAVMLAERLASRGVLALEPRHVARGLARASWPGRIEIVAGSPDLLLDGGHNPSGTATLADYLRDHRPGRRMALVFAAMKDKPADAMLRPLAPLMKTIMLTSVPVGRAAAPADLLRAAAAAGIGAVQEPDPARALDRARDAAGRDGMVIVCGSLYLVGEIKKHLASGPGSNPDAH